MAEMPNVAAGELIQAAWGNQIRDRTIQRYATAAVRESEHPTPVVGDMSYLEDSHIVERWNGTAWGGTQDGKYLSLSAGGTVQGPATFTDNGIWFSRDGVGANRIQTDGNRRLIVTNVDGVVLLQLGGPGGVPVQNYVYGGLAPLLYPGTSLPPVGSGASAWPPGLLQSLYGASDSGYPGVYGTVLSVMSASGTSGRFFQIAGDRAGNLYVRTANGASDTYTAWAQLVTSAELTETMEPVNEYRDEVNDLRDEVNDLRAEVNQLRSRLVECCGEW